MAGWGVQRPVSSPPLSIARGPGTPVLDLARHGGSITPRAIERALPRIAALGSAVLIAALLCMGLVPGVGAASPAPASSVNGHHFELIRWMDPASWEMSEARTYRDSGVLLAINAAMDQSDRDGTRWFKAALECPGDTLPWPLHAQAFVTLKSGLVVRSVEVMAYQDDPRMLPFYPAHQLVRTGQIHMLPARSGWERPALLLVGFPPSPRFDISDVSVVVVAAPDAYTGNLGGQK
jgi:hypothetical protein